MGSSVPPRVPCSKGAACQALDALSKDRAGLERLQTALQAIRSGGYSGIEKVLGQHLLPVLYKESEIEQIVAHLKACWFDPTSHDCYFPGQPVAEIYGRGLNMTLALALESTPCLPIDAWWALDHGAVEMLNFRTEHQVTLVIATPRPKRSSAVSDRLERSSVGYSTHVEDGAVQDRKLPIPQR